jgi:hypothetical protein
VQAPIRCPDDVKALVGLLGGSRRARARGLWRWGGRRRRRGRGRPGRRRRRAEWRADLLRRRAADPAALVFALPLRGAHRRLLARDLRTGARSGGDHRRRDGRRPHAALARRRHRRLPAPAPVARRRAALRRREGHAACVGRHRRARRRPGGRAAPLPAAADRARRPPTSSSSPTRCRSSRGSPTSSSVWSTTPRLDRGQMFVDGPQLRGGRSTKSRITRSCFASSRNDAEACPVAMSASSASARRGPELIHAWAPGQPAARDAADRGHASSRRTR